MRFDDLFVIIQLLNIGPLGSMLFIIYVKLQLLGGFNYPVISYVFENVDIIEQEEQIVFCAPRMSGIKFL